MVEHSAQRVKWMKNSCTIKSGSNGGEEPATVPIIFQARGLHPDLRLQVFKTPFYVHSIILKLHSEFFFEFLDSPDKKDLAASNAEGLKYEWVTKVDEDGLGWALVNDRSIEVSQLSIFYFTNGLQGGGWMDSNIQDPMLTRKKALIDPAYTLGEYVREFNGNEMKETQAFKNLLHAIYNECYELEDTDQLCLMTKLADYYFALPVLSKSLNGPLMASKIDIASNTLRLIKVATKLRHAPLYKDCVIYLAGRWNEETTCKDVHQLDGHSSAVVLKSRNKILQAIAHAQQIIIHYEHSFPSIKKITQNLLVHPGRLLPGYFHQLSDASFDPSQAGTDLQRFQESVAPLVNDNLFFKKRYVPGDDLYERYFLCTNVDHGDLPWKWEESYCR
jgi:hypothetical protein